MAQFKEYAKYYDLLYKDKDYTEEVEYIQSFVQKYHPSAKSILDLGCGTGTHLSKFQEKGYDVSGVDISSQMIEVARKKNPTTNFYCQDIAKVSLQQQFDLVTALFHVISYQVDNDALIQTFRAARNHLKPGGIFLFDCWYGPGVLTDRPCVRIKRLEDNNLTITRIAEPTMFPNDNCVNIDYTIFVTEKDSNKTTEFAESHRMRYLFKPEIEYICSQVGFHVLEGVEFLSDSALGFQSWYALFVVG